MGDGAAGQGNAALFGAGRLHVGLLNDFTVDLGKRRRGAKHGQEQGELAKRHHSHPPTAFELAAGEAVDCLRFWLQIRHPGLA